MKLNGKYTYQNNFSNNNSSVLNSDVRIIKAKKIFSVIKDYLKNTKGDLNKMTCLDIGGSAGFTAKLMSPCVKKFYVVDIDKNAIEFGKKNNFANNIGYEQGDAMNLRFKDKSMDIIVCNHVYEHVSNYHKLASEIYRVLKNDGFCYFGAGNRLNIVERHHNLPFLSWLPKFMANIYLRLMKKGSIYYENLLSYYGLKKLLRDFKIKDYTLEVINNPTKYYATDLIKNNSLISYLPKFALKAIWLFIPIYIFNNQKTVVVNATRIIPRIYM